MYTGMYNIISIRDTNFPLPQPLSNKLTVKLTQGLLWFDFL